ncbi:tRNA (adenosine(37)-N6)-threonylcarbamoyltransferase complex ATPase subunit type 1 TsaE [Candidatus Giovannonibacteria bacterium]|nr:tRNA (adenosine(37)-N6)-threonylcarbamoyltransferase complex ATPase subunit type 1 TsaE [Candidatus Giovannonibacteria bacterium]
MTEALRVTTKNEKETKKFAELFARELKIFSARTRQKKALVIGLEGELGAGKTSFTKGFAKGLGIKEEMKSPTFILMRVFRVPKSKSHFFHFDAYRISDSKEFLALGFKSLLNNPNNILLIEWADLVQKILPKNYFKLKFKLISRTSREIKLLI